MLGRVSSNVPGKVSALLASFPAQIPQQFFNFSVPRRTNIKILSYRSKDPEENCPNNGRLVTGNSTVHSDKPKLLGKPTIVEGNSILTHLAEELLVTSSKFNKENAAEVEAKEQEEEELEYYDAKTGDLVVGVVVASNENRLDINIGSDRLATMFMNEVLPVNQSEMERLLCDMPTVSNANGNDDNNTIFFPNGKMGILKEKRAMSHDLMTTQSPVIGEGDVLHAEVLGRTISGEPLLSSRRAARRLAWHRVRQIKEVNEPIEIYISEWNTGGLISRIEGLRAFLPKGEMLDAPFNNFAALKENVGMQMSVAITRVDEATDELIISEKIAWEMRNLHEGSLLQGTIKRLYSYGAQVKIDGTSISGLLHISNISCARVPFVKDVFSEGEKVKVMVVRSKFPNKVFFSTADLESEKGLIFSNKKKVFEEAEQIAAAYRGKLREAADRNDLSVWHMHEKEVSPDDSDTCESVAKCYANWDWLKFEPESGLYINPG